MLKNILATVLWDSYLKATKTHAFSCKNEYKVQATLKKKYRNHPNELPFITE